MKRSTPKQIVARKRNWNIFKLRGILGQLQNYRIQQRDSKVKQCISNSIGEISYILDHLKGNIT